MLLSIFLFLTSLQTALEYTLMICLLGAGLWLTFRLGFLQFRRLGHGIAVVSGRYDKPGASGDMSHFQALTTALSATVGIGNIAGVALAIHWGGPGAIFWMWVTAVLGMATKFSEVTLAQRFRVQLPAEDGQKVGTVAGGPMYYIEKGLGKKWRPLALFFAFALMLAAFVSGNAIQANTISDLMRTVFGVPTWLTGCITAAVVGLVIIGGISRIGQVTGFLAPAMAGIYVLGGLAVIMGNAGEIIPSLRLIVVEAFEPTAGVAGTGVGVFLQTLLWGVRRGLFSNEAGQGSAPIAHSAARTDEPVSEGVVALLEPFIDTILICSITALAILTTGVWKDTTPTEIWLSSGDISFVDASAEWPTARSVVYPLELEVVQGVIPKADVQLAWHEVAVDSFFIDEAHQQVFSGKLHLSGRTGENIALSADGQEYKRLFGLAVENGAPLTMWAYSAVLGQFGVYLVLFCVLLFGISTAISWSYYGDRCAIYLFGTRAILPYRILFVGMHFLGAVLSLQLVWDLGDLAMSLGTIPNVLALVLLSGLVRRMSQDYFARMRKE
ncbi:MAG: sodium:alanine symporter family protein [Bacteroidota bacterium]